MPARLKRADATAVYKALRKKFGARGTHVKKDPMDNIVFSVLASIGSSGNVDKVFSAIKSGFVDWNEVRVTSIRELSSVIESRGGDPKSVDPVKAFLQRLYTDSHAVSAGWIEKMPLKKAVEYMEKTTGLAGEQVTTLLLETFDMPVAPIDQKIKRVLVRLGLARKDATQGHLQKMFALIASKGKTSTAYRLMHILARETCVEGEPKCHRCCVKKHCPIGTRRIQKGLVVKCRGPAPGKKSISKKAGKTRPAKKTKQAGSKKKVGSPRRAKK